MHLPLITLIIDVTKRTQIKYSLKELDEVRKEYKAL